MEYIILAIAFYCILLNTLSITMVIALKRSKQADRPQIEHCRACNILLTEHNHGCLEVDLRQVPIVPDVETPDVSTTIADVENQLLSDYKQYQALITHVRALVCPAQRDTDKCPKCGQYNQSNPHIDTDAEHLSYRIPLEPKHQYHTVNINALCKVCVDKLHNEIDTALFGKLTDKPKYQSFSKSGKSDLVTLEFEILVDGQSAYKGYDPKRIKPSMACKHAKPDKYATPWLSIADIKATGNERYIINDCPYKVTARDVKKTAMPKLINGLQAQGIDYAVSVDDGKYTIVEKVTV